MSRKYVRTLTDLELAHATRELEIPPQRPDCTRSESLHPPGPDPLPYTLQDLTHTSNAHAATLMLQRTLIASRTT